MPRLPPAVDGVGDYAFNLARQLRLDYGLDTHFLIGDLDWVGSEQLEGFQITKVTDRSAASLCLQLAQINPKSPILLHYVGYGYAKRGCPVWLATGLKAWKHQCKSARLVTMFHETSASGPIWTSAFWLSGLQENLAKQLVGLSDRVLTSKQLYAEILQRFINQKANSQNNSKLPIPALPVFSNVGEPDIILPLDKRDRTVVVFGGFATRTRAYRHSQSELVYACKQFNIKKVIDIGPYNRLNPASIGNIPIDILGPRSALEVSQILLSSFAGFIDYPTDFLGKSTVFAGYCAHGVLPIVKGIHDLDADGLIKQQHYWHVDSTYTSINESIAQEIANNAYAWYQAHNLATQAGQFTKFLS